MDTLSLSHTNTTAKIVLVIFYELPRVQSRVRSVKTTIRMNISFVYIFLFCIELTKTITQSIPLIYFLLFIYFYFWIMSLMWNLFLEWSRVYNIGTVIGHPLFPIYHQHAMPCHVAVSLFFFQTKDKRC